MTIANLKFGIVEVVAVDRRLRVRNVLSLPDVVAPDIALALL